MVEMIIQIGKKGISQNIIENLKRYFKTRESIKVRILRSACRDKEEAEKMSEEIINALGNNYTYRLIGYTISIRKWRKPKR